LLKENGYIFVTIDRELLHRDYAMKLQLASINPVNGIAIVAALQIRY
jgi:hypothetical protein